MNATTEHTDASTFYSFRPQVLYASNMLRTSTPRWNRMFESFGGGELQHDRNSDLREYNSIDVLLMRLSKELFIVKANNMERVIGTECLKLRRKGNQL
ncbi:hypothetical protein BCR33DRAFT_711018, partial [Rhizoclosmatium globosum]